MKSKSKSMEGRGARVLFRKRKEFGWLMSGAYEGVIRGL